MKVNGRVGAPKILENRDFSRKRRSFLKTLEKCQKEALSRKPKKALFSCFFAFLACFFASIRLETTFPFRGGLVVREIHENCRIFSFFRVFKLQIYKNTKKNTLFFPCT